MFTLMSAAVAVKGTLIGAALGAATVMALMAGCRMAKERAR